jgi:hypothetical protein
MPIYVHFDDEQHTLIRYEFVGRWTWMEYDGAIKEASDLAKPIPHNVNMILDFSRENVLPPNVLSNIGSSMKALPREFDFALVVSESAFIQALVKVYQRGYPRLGSKVSYVKTLEEARAFAARCRGELRVSS